MKNYTETLKKTKRQPEKGCRSRVNLQYPKQNSYS